MAGPAPLKGTKVGFTPIIELSKRPKVNVREPEPSLKIPGIIISLIFSEQRKLVFRATPLQN